MKLRAGADPVLYLSNPPGVDRELRRDMLDGVAKLNALEFERSGTPRSKRERGSTNWRTRCKLRCRSWWISRARRRRRWRFTARRETAWIVRGELPDGKAAVGARSAVRAVVSPGWDNHGSLPTNIPKQAKDIDQPQAALIQDLKRRGMLDDTLVVWGGEFGRTVYGQGGLQADYGRDHHGRCFSVWLAGGGIKPGVIGETDDYGYNIVNDPVHVHDLNATILDRLGFDHERLTYRFQGRDYRLTDIHGRVVEAMLA